MQTKLKVEGMHCEGCSGRVQRVLERAPGVEAAEVSLERGEAVVRHEGSTGPDALREVVERAGYRAAVQAP